jgi:hypothetical protein
VSQEPEPESAFYRTLFLSDAHLGTRGCQAELLLDFLKHNDAATIYLVGDMIDGWQLKGGWYWPQAHNDVVQKLLRKVRKGVARSTCRGIMMSSRAAMSDWFLAASRLRIMPTI